MIRPKEKRHHLRNLLLVMRKSGNAKKKLATLFYDDPEAPHNFLVESTSRFA